SKHSSAYCLPIAAARWVDSSPSWTSPTDLRARRPVWLPASSAMPPFICWVPPVRCWARLLSSPAALRQLYCHIATLSRSTRMSRIFISGSSTGLGLMAAKLLVQQGHQVVLHARNANRAEDIRRELPEAEAIVRGDLETIAGAQDVA